MQETIEQNEVKVRTTQISLFELWQLSMVIDGQLSIKVESRASDCVAVLRCVIVQCGKYRIR